MVLLSDELIEWLQQNMRPKGSIGDASSDERAQRNKKMAEPLGQKSRQVRGREEKSPKVAREVTTTRKSVRFRVYRVAPLLAVVLGGEE